MKFLRKSFRGQIILIFMPVVTAVMLIVMLAYYNTSSKIIEEQTADRMIGSLSNATAFLDEMLERTRGELIRFANDEDIIESIENIGVFNSYDYLISSQLMRSKIADVHIWADYIDNIYVYASDSLAFFKTDQARTMSFDDILDTDWYYLASTSALNEWVFYHDDVDDSGRRMLMQSTPIQNSRTQDIGIVSMGIRVETLGLALNTAKVTKDSEYYIADENGIILYHSNSEQIGEEIDPFARQSLLNQNQTSVTHGRFIASISSNAIDGWVYFVESQAEDIFEPLLALQRATWILMAISVISMLLVISMVSKRVVQPIHLLRKYIKSARENNYKDRIEIDREDEFAELFGSYNELIEKTDQLINDNYAQKFLITQLQVKNLQVQIGPHFLYNALDAIHWAVRDGSKDEACDMIYYLADHFRKGLTDGREVLPVHECAEILDSYIALQNALSENTIKVTTYVNPLVANIPVLKYLFQPIVENAFKHGLTAKKGYREVYIAFEAVGGGCLRFIVRDNGVGMSPAKLREIEDSLKHANSIDMQEHLALKNISLQLKTLYDGASLKIESKLGEGTTVSFEIEP